MTSRNLGIVEVTLGMLLDCLRLPRGSVIEAIEWSMDYPDILRLMVSNPDLPETLLGAKVPVVSYRLKDDEKYGHFSP